MLLQWSIGLAALTVLYRLSRSALSFPISVGIIAFTIAALVFQQCLQQTMSDLCCFLWAVLLVHAAVRFVETQDRTSTTLVVLWLSLAALTKGTAVCLMPVPVVALLASRQSIRIPLRWIAAGAACLLTVAAWYLAIGGVMQWGGISVTLPWSGALIGHLAGWGFLALTLLGLRRHPLAVVAASVIVCTLGVSFVVRAMLEPRHWIFALPAILLLAGFAVSRVRRPIPAVGLLIPAVLPYSWYRQPPSGYGDLIRQLHTPARMLISSAGFGEGPWIAITALSEQRPGSLVARASKVIVEEGWNGQKYRLLTPTSGALLERLDELAIDVVVLHTPPTPRPAPVHHALLQQTMEGSLAWTPCGQAKELIAYCRAGTPLSPRRPLHLRIRGWDLEERLPP